MPRRVAQLEWLHRANGRDPDTMEAALLDAETELARAKEMLDAELPDEELPDAPIDFKPLPQSLEERRLQAAVRKTCESIVTLREYIESREEADVLLAFETHFCFAAIKAGRIAFSTHHGDSEFFDEDVAPNLLVLEATIRRTRVALAAVQRLGSRASNTARAFDEMTRLCEPWLERITDKHRAELATRIESNEAPSPFATTEN